MHCRMLSPVTFQAFTRNPTDVDVSAVDREFIPRYIDCHPCRDMLVCIEAQDVTILHQPGARGRKPEPEKRQHRGGRLSGRHATRPGRRIGDEPMSLAGVGAHGNTMVPPSLPSLPSLVPPCSSTLPFLSCLALAVPAAAPFALRSLWRRLVPFLTPLSFFSPGSSSFSLVEGLSFNCSKPDYIFVIAVDRNFFPVLFGELFCGEPTVQPSRRGKGVGLRAPWRSRAMDQQLAPAELLRFLQAEAERLQQMQTRISNELHHLQVEEEIYVRTLDRLNQNAASNQNNSTNGNAGRQPGLELLDALHQELASAVPPASMLPRDSSAPTTLAITAMESHGDEDMKMELLLAVPSDLGFPDDEQEEYELLDALESGAVKL